MDAHHRPSETAETFSGRPKSGKPFDFEAHAWRDGATGLPLVAKAAFECNLQSSHDAGTHVILIGRAIAAHKGEAEPLVFCNRAFWRITNH